MIEKIQSIIDTLKSTTFFESKLNFFEVHAVKADEERVFLDGKVLEKENLELLKEKIAAEFPALEILSENVTVLRTPETPVLNVCKNITSMHAEKSFQSELTTQLFFSDEVEVLIDEGDWVIGRNVLDGYISYTYRKYLDKLALPEFTHIVSEPVVPVYDAPENGRLITRVLGGTKTGIMDTSGEMVRIRANIDGWIPKDFLRAFDELPEEKHALRALVCENAKKLIGVPYLWGGNTANGIDCSGLVQYAYRLAGITTLRDAHMQYIAEQIVEPEFLPGDVVLYGEQRKDRMSVTHASISLGGWTVIHSSRTRNGVYIDNVQETEHLKASFSAAIRYL